MNLSALFRLSALALLFDLLQSTPVFSQATIWFATDSDSFLQALVRVRAQNNDGSGTNAVPSSPPNLTAEQQGRLTEINSSAMQTADAMRELASSMLEGVAVSFEGGEDVFESSTVGRLSIESAPGMGATITLEAKTT